MSVTGSRNRSMRAHVVRCIGEWLMRMCATGVIASVAYAQDVVGRTPVPAPTIALFYGESVPVGQLNGFDVVVVEPDATFDPRAYPDKKPAWFAYASVGEVNGERRYAVRMPRKWLIGANQAWAAAVIDQAAPGWPDFFVDHVIAPLWERGYRGFFLDTLDSYQLVAKTGAARAGQEAGIVRVIRKLKARYPSARLILNRGFEVLPQVHGLVDMVAFESLYRGWDPVKQQYTEVSPPDRDWLLAQARSIRTQYGLPVLAIDYCPERDEQCRKDTASRIVAAGLTPYVTDGGLMTVGYGKAVRLK